MADVRPPFYSAHIARLLLGALICKRQSSSRFCGFQRTHVALRRLPG